MSNHIDKQTAFSRPLKTSIYSFLALMVATTALAAVKVWGVIDARTSMRGFGLLIGLMIVVMGNFLPKIRPLRTTDGAQGPAMAAERSAGWILVLAGITYLALFAFAPLELARTVSSIVGICAIVVVAANWAWKSRGMLAGIEARCEDSTALDRQTDQRRKLIANLLFAFLWVLAAACTKFLFGNRPWISDIASWMTVGFSILYAALLVVLDLKRCAR